MGSFFRNNFYKIKIVLSLPAIIYLLIFIFNRYNLPINTKAVPKEGVDFIIYSGFDSFINIFTNSIGVTPFNIVEKIIIFLLILAFTLTTLLGYFKLYKFIGATLFMIFKYIYIGYTNYTQKLDVILEISWLKLIFYREGSIDEIYEIIDYVIECFDRPELEKAIDKGDLLNFVLNSNFKTTQEIINNLISYITDHYLDLLIKCEGNYHTLLIDGTFFTFAAITLFWAFATSGLNLNMMEGSVVVCSYLALTKVSFSFVLNQVMMENIEETIIKAKDMENIELNKENSPIIEEIQKIKKTR